MNENVSRRKALIAGLSDAVGCALLPKNVLAQGQSAATPPGPAEIPQDPRIAELVSRGATMEEIARVREPVARNPAEAVRALKTGNARFFSV